MRTLLGLLSKIQECRRNSGHFTQPKQFYNNCLNIVDTIKFFTVIIFSILKRKHLKTTISRLQSSKGQDLYPKVSHIFDIKH